jgi:hypothetical protein
MPYKDKTKDKEAKIRHLRANKDYYRQKSTARKEMLRQYLLDYKKRSHCKICLISDPVVLQFHHRNPSEKDISISNVVSRGWSLTRLDKEIEKCDILCANCHLKFHSEQKNNNIS